MARVRRSFAGVARTAEQPPRKRQVASSNLAARAIWEQAVALLEAHCPNTTLGSDKRYEYRCSCGASEFIPMDVAPTNARWHAEHRIDALAKAGLLGQTNQAESTLLVARAQVHLQRATEHNLAVVKAIGEARGLLERDLRARQTPSEVAAATRRAEAAERRSRR